MKPIAPFKTLSVSRLNALVNVFNALLRAKIVRGDADRLVWADGELTIFIKG